MSTTKIEHVSSILVASRTCHRGAVTQLTRLRVTALLALIFLSVPSRSLWAQAWADTPFWKSWCAVPGHCLHHCITSDQCFTNVLVNPPGWNAQDQNCDASKGDICPGSTSAQPAKAGRPCPPVQAKNAEEALMMESASNKIGCWVRLRSGLLGFVSDRQCPLRCWN